MTTNPTAPSGAVKPPAPAGRHRITDYDSLIDELAYTYDGTFAGSHPADQINPVAVQVLAERGINLTRTPNRSGDVVHAADVTVTMGCGDTCPIYPGKRYLDWDEPDPNDHAIAEVRDIRDDLRARVTALLRDLHI